MSHNFLFSTYDYIARRLADLEQALTRSDADEDARQYAAGRIDVLCQFERFLGENFDIKLPRRLRNKRADAPAVCKRFVHKD